MFFIFQYDDLTYIETAILRLRYEVISGSSEAYVHRKSIITAVCRSECLLDRSSVTSVCSVHRGRGGDCR